MICATHTNVYIHATTRSHEPVELKVKSAIGPEGTSMGSLWPCTPGRSTRYSGRSIWSNSHGGKIKIAHLLPLLPIGGSHSEPPSGCDNYRRQYPRAISFDAAAIIKASCRTYRTSHDAEIVRCCNVSGHSSPAVLCAVSRLRERAISNNDRLGNHIYLVSLRTQTLPSHKVFRGGRAQERKTVVCSTRTKKSGRTQGLTPGGSGDCTSASP